MAACPELVTALAVLRSAPTPEYTDKKGPLQASMGVGLFPPFRMTVSVPRQEDPGVSPGLRGLSARCCCGSEWGLRAALLLTGYPGLGLSRSCSWACCGLAQAVLGCVTEPWTER